MNYLKIAKKGLFLFAGLSAVLFTFSCESEKKTERPNIVFIMSDDHAYQAISAYDNKLIETPNIDRIAQKGMLFTNASVTNSICAPSRATILTGKHSHMNGKVDNVNPFDTTNVTFPQLLQDAGYQTAMFGKLHFGNSPKGFDQFKILPGQGDYYNPDFITKNEGKITVKGYVTDIITDMTLDWLDKEREEEKPFMLMYLHKAPHRSWFMAERHMEEFTNKTFPEPATLFDSHEGMPAAKAAEMNISGNMGWGYDLKIYPETMDEIGLEEMSSFDKSGFDRYYNRLDSSQKANFDLFYKKRSADLKERYPSMTKEDLTKWRYQVYMQDYLGTIKSVDENVGRVLDYLEENNLMDNTIIVYTSDQGFYLGEHGWFDKRFVYDESFKTPLLVSWPNRVKAGSVSDELVQNLDFAQTFLDVAGVEQPAEMQGKSMVPVLTGDTENWNRDAVYYHYYEHPSEHNVNRHYAAVTKDYKLIHYYFDLDYWELIDRKKDPLEQHNYYGDPAYAEIQKEMHAKLDGLREQYGDNETISQKYIDDYMPLAKEGNSFGVSDEILKGIVDKWEAK
ncbi:sulfatase family protein [Arcticibacterium luteifluviistationis]|uniref:Sulfatase n=1 Tax=Arcticibacterium luteifluviistationis TaxID=1784714 RepID=A0A2Z4GBU1_9BACT|nr:sulfatase [Arcticibacterium luteifluviistationis]AWV98525.1 sulfatase [Arcticibacterium luteifluviistationis]